MYTATNAPASMGHQNPCSRRIDPTTGWPVADRNEGLYAAMTTSYDPTAASPGSCKKPSITAKARLFCFANYACGFAVAVFVVFVLTCGISQSKLFKNRVAPLLGKAPEKGGGAATAASAAGAASSSAEGSAQLLAAKPAGPAAAAASTSRDFLAPRTMPADLAEADEGSASAQDAEAEEDGQQRETEPETSSEVTDSTSSSTAAEEAEPTSSPETEEYQAAGDERVANAAGDGAAEDDEEAGESFLGEKTTAAAALRMGAKFVPRMLKASKGFAKNVGPALAEAFGAGAAEKTVELASRTTRGDPTPRSRHSHSEDTSAATPETPGKTSGRAPSQQQKQRAPFSHESFTQLLNQPTSPRHKASASGPGAPGLEMQEELGRRMTSDARRRTEASLFTQMPEQPSPFRHESSAASEGTSAREMRLAKPQQENSAQEQACAQEAGEDEGGRTLGSDFSVLPSQSVETAGPLSTVPFATINVPGSRNEEFVPAAVAGNGRRANVGDRDHAFIETLNLAETNAGTRTASNGGAPRRSHSAPASGRRTPHQKDWVENLKDGVQDVVGHVWNEAVVPAGQILLDGMVANGGKHLADVAGRAVHHADDAAGRAVHHADRSMGDAVNRMGLPGESKPTAPRP